MECVGVRRDVYDDSRLVFFFFNDTATTEIYTLSLHDALPISIPGPAPVPQRRRARPRRQMGRDRPRPHLPARGSRQGRLQDRKSTRLNSSHANISYAVFCLKKKKLATFDRLRTRIDRPLPVDQ